MKKQYEAYYSEYWAWFWLFLSIVFCVIITVFSVWYLETISLTFIIVSSICVIIFFLMFVKTKRETGIAVEIIDDILILHKKETISIPIKDIQRIDVHNADGSFDILVKTANKKYSMHCFIKEQRQKKTLFIDYLKNNNIKVKTYDLL
ncbi:MAG: hypothetical protein Q4B04_05530 [bacterium]|nr:hypothetical protein [bacterium]